MCLRALCLGVSVLLAVSAVQLSGQQQRCSSPHRQRRHRWRGHQRQRTEAGVWVIAETTDLPTKFAKIVVTDDQGRYLLPDLPKAN